MFRNGEKNVTGVYVFLFDPGVGTKIWPNIMLGKNMIKRGRKKLEKRA